MQKQINEKSNADKVTALRTKLDILIDHQCASSCSNKILTKNLLSRIAFGVEEVAKSKMSTAAIVFDSELNGKTLPAAING